jgi:hypothetical protein
MRVKEEERGNWEARLLPTMGKRDRKKNFRP